jgi:hypothetical protein
MRRLPLCSSAPARAAVVVCAYRESGEQHGTSWGITSHITDYHLDGR